MKPPTDERACSTFLQLFDRDVEVLWGGLVFPIFKVENKEILCFGSVGPDVNVAQEVHVHRLLGAVPAGGQRFPPLLFLRRGLDK